MHITVPTHIWFAIALIALLLLAGISMSWYQSKKSQMLAKKIENLTGEKNAQLEKEKTLTKQNNDLNQKIEGLIAENTAHANQLETLRIKLQTQQRQHDRPTDSSEAPALLSAAPLEPNATRNGADSGAPDAKQTLDQKRLDQSMSPSGNDANTVLDEIEGELATESQHVVYKRYENESGPDSTSSLYQKIRQFLQNHSVSRSKEEKVAQDLSENGSSQGSDSKWAFDQRVVYADTTNHKSLQVTYWFGKKRISDKTIHTIVQWVEDPGSVIKANTSVLKQSLQSLLMNKSKKKKPARFILFAWNTDVKRKSKHHNQLNKQYKKLNSNSFTPQKSKEIYNSLDQIKKALKPKGAKGTTVSHLESPAPSLASQQ